MSKKAKRVRCLNCNSKRVDHWVSKDGKSWVTACYACGTVNGEGKEAGEAMKATYWDAVKEVPGLGQ
jgi:uncharacterized Zn finger protein